MTDQAQPSLVTPPTSGLDPMIALATSVHASPGVYALLLGSGVSSATGIPTGWQIVSDLVRRAATAKFPDDPAAGAAAGDDPETWWSQHGESQPLGYSGLLEALAPTPAARNALLSGYFEPTPAELADGRKAPGEAHRAVAGLIARGSLRVVVTTNFDRLLERALEAVGVQPQVLSRPEQIVGATVLRHHRATIIKLHGDYADLDKRNTVDELQTYSPEFEGLLRTVLDEYGLLVSGWSADWDLALVSALEATHNRRYPLFWGFYGTSLGDSASRLVAQHGAVQLPGQTADSLLGGLVIRLEALDRLADPPISRAMAVARLKRALPDPVRRIELYDLLDREVTGVVERVQDTQRYPLMPPYGATNQVFDDRISDLRNDVDTLLYLLTHGLFHDEDGANDALWVRVVQRLMGAHTPVPGQPVHQYLNGLRRYPALLALCTAGVAAVVAGRDITAVRLLRRPLWRSHDGIQDEQTAVKALRPHRVVDDNMIKGLPRWGGSNSNFYFAPSHLLRLDIREPLRQIEPDDKRLEAAFDRFELIAGLVALTSGGKYDRNIWWGEVGLADHWTYDAADGELYHRGLREVVTNVKNNQAFQQALALDPADSVRIAEELIAAVGQMREKSRW